MRVVSGRDQTPQQGGWQLRLCTGGPTSRWGNKAFCPWESTASVISPALRSAPSWKFGEKLPQNPRGLLLEKLLRQRFWEELQPLALQTFSPF